MKKTLVGLFTLAALAVGIQVAQAACPCTSSCPTPMVTCPCSPACPVADACPCPAAPCATACPCATNCDCCNGCCDPGACRPKCKCTWWKIFEDKTCCYKCNNECDSCLSAKRAHWYKFWTDRCVVKNTKCSDCCKSCN